MDIHGITARIKGALAKTEGSSGNTLAAGHGNQPSSGENDSLNLSAISKILNQEPTGQPEWGTSFKTIPPIPHTVAELQDSLDSYITAVRERISQIFDSAGIQLQEDVQIQSNNENGYSISAAEPQLDAVINALGQDPQLGAQLNHLQQRHQLTGLLNAASALSKGEDKDNNGDVFRSLRAQQTPLTLVIAANDSAESSAPDLANQQQ